MRLFLSLITGICWTIVYVELIRTGFKEKTYGMPFIALALNFAWEGLYAYVGITSNLLNIETLFILLWFLLDILIVYTYLKYGAKYLPNFKVKKFFTPWTEIIFLMSFVIQYYFYIEFGASGKVYSAFILNLIMSILFITMFFTRQDTKGQNLLIAISKWIGTLAPTIYFGLIEGNKFILALGIFCSVFDMIYIYFLNDAIKTSVNPQNKFTISSPK